MTASLARYLPDFEGTHIAAFQVSRHDGASTPPTLPAIDIASERAAARAEGEAAVRAELAARHKAEREAEAARHAAELEALRAELEVKAVATLAGALAAQRAEIAEQLADGVEAVLAPIVDRTIRARMVAALAAEIRDSLDPEAAGRIVVSGPEGLVVALRETLGPAADKLVVRDGGGIDIEVEIDRTRFATRMAAWADALAETAE
ncbi:hypothetical protein [Hoeflea olei]|uniref:Flagellar assembly protein FliH/Type III secretion system HrpE domain-containing protein n=1 Tax=Hoeflea olei TaxID=1480615 RepID=A0A1C1YRZ1_9HYPH|nr:hypothetical protein [Hoeflea olei]OCW56186.1 hypothetical protein AWJ14_18990 [Hoeflea olei]